MSAEQVQVIKDLSFAPEDMQALMQQYGVQAPQGAPQQSTTRTANSAGQGGGGMRLDGGGMPGGAPPDGGGMPGGRQANAQPTPQAGQGNRARGGGGINGLFVDPLIKLLEERAKS